MWTRRGIQTCGAAGFSLLFFSFPQTKKVTGASRGRGNAAKGLVLVPRRKRWGRQDFRLWRSGKPGYFRKGANELADNISGLALLRAGLARFRQSEPRISGNVEIFPRQVVRKDTRDQNQKPKGKRGCLF